MNRWIKPIEEPVPGERRDEDLSINENQACAACHVSGVAGAPKSHDVAAWESRMSKGMDALVASVENGLNAMPPTGLCADCTDEEYQELITYMATAK